MADPLTACRVGFDASALGALTADLRGANLRDADLTGADLRDADLRGADLVNVFLRGADLRGANLRDADLTGADLRGADLRGANLRGADLRDAIGLLHLGIRSDGYRFYAHDRGALGWYILAGCRYLPLAEARQHWAETRGGTPLGAETKAILERAERMIALRQEP